MFILFGLFFFLAISMCLLLNREALLKEDSKISCVTVSVKCGQLTRTAMMVQCRFINKQLLPERRRKGHQFSFVREVASSPTLSSCWNGKVSTSLLAL